LSLGKVKTIDEAEEMANSICPKAKVKPELNFLFLKNEMNEEIIDPYLRSQ